MSNSITSESIPKIRIHFTQYLMPDGRTKDVWVERGGEVANQYNALKEAGISLEIEMLQTGHISMTAELGEDTLAHEICDNGPAVSACVDALIRNAFHALSETKQD